MLKVTNRAELARLKGERSPISPEIRPDPLAPAVAALQDTVAQLAGQVQQAARIVAAAKTVPNKTMEAIVHRDSDGRMQKVTITVKEEQ